MVDLLPGLNFESPDAQRLLVEHLLAHVGGLPKNAGDPKNGEWIPADQDRVDFDRRVAHQLNNDTLPIGTDLAFKFLTAKERFVTAPGTLGAHHYSNSGYELLAEIARKRSGRKLIDQVREHIFERVGIRLDDASRAPRWAASERLDDQRGEARYHTPSLKTLQSVASASEPRVSRAYGEWNMERMHGFAAWAISAPHYLRIISRFNAPGLNPLFTKSDTETDFKSRYRIVRLGPNDPNPDPLLNKLLDVTRGGLGRRDVAGGFRWSHTGAAPGARAAFFFRDDGWSLVYLTNSADGVDDEDDASVRELERWLDHARGRLTTGWSPDALAWRKVFVSVPNLPGVGPSAG